MGKNQGTTPDPRGSAAARPGYTCINSTSNSSNNGNMRRISITRVS
jgi:hypothetical protein